MGWLLLRFLSVPIVPCTRLAIVFTFWHSVICCCRCYCCSCSLRVPHFFSHSLGFFSALFHFSVLFFLFLFLVGQNLLLCTQCKLPSLSRKSFVGIGLNAILMNRLEKMQNFFLCHATLKQGDFIVGWAHIFKPTTFKLTFPNWC